MSINLGLGNFLGNIPKNERNEKGLSLLECRKDYIVIDIETTGLDPTYDDIIEIAALRIENNKIISKFQSLINPGYEIPDFITSLTGITNEMIKDSPSIDKILSDYLSFISDSIIIGHNVNFDINFIYDNNVKYFGNTFSNNYIDTMRLSRRLFPEERHHRLVDLKNRFNLSSDSAHRALDDTMLTQQCYQFMKNYIEENNIVYDDLYPKKHNLKASSVKTENTDFDTNSLFYQKCFVFTGTLERMIRKDAMQLVVDLGGKCTDGVTLKTNYLVLGNNDYCSTIKNGKSSKQKKAEELRIKGKDIEIISENTFYEMLNNTLGNE